MEDEKNTSFLISRMLISMGHKVAGTAVSCDETLKIIEQQIPDLILMDIMIEGNKDGIETANIIKQKYDLPVIFLTAFSDDKTIERAKVCGPYGFIIKPFESRDLKSAIEIALNKIAAEKEIKKSELWFRTTLNSIADGVIAYDEHEKIKYMNNVALGLTGYSLQDCIGKNIDDVYKTSPDLTSEGLIYMMAENAGNIKTAFQNYKILMAKKGLKIPIEENISTIDAENGNIIGTVITFRDISLKRNTQLQMMSAKDFYLNIFEKFPVLIWRTNKEKQFNYFNNFWLEFTGRDIDAQIFDRWLANIHPEDKDNFIELFETSFKKKEKFEIEMRLLNSENEYRWLLCFASPINNIEGDFDGYIGVSLDIDNRKILEEELIQAKNNSDASSKLKSSFMANISHEIRTPLNGIVGLTDLLMDTKLNTEQKEFLDMIKESSRTLLNLLNNLLDFSKLEDNKESLIEDKFNLALVIKEIVDPFKSVARRNGVVIESQMGKSIPEQLYGDGRKIQRILSNLLSNAFKFTQSGYVKLSVRNETHNDISDNEKERVLLHFVVSDSGIGIPVEKQEMIFDSFTQVDASKTRKYSGSGLGLAIVKRLVEIMDGKIWVESQIGKGSKFHFVLELKLRKKGKTLLTETN